MANATQKRSKELLLTPPGNILPSTTPNSVTKTASNLGVILAGAFAVILFWQWLGNNFQTKERADVESKNNADAHARIESYLEKMDQRQEKISVKIDRLLRGKDE